MDEIYKVCKDWGYCYESGIHEKKEYWKNKNILDVGMGQGPHSIYYIYHGAKSYTGVDPDMKLDGTGSVRNHTDDTTREIFPYSPNYIMKLFPNIKLYPTILENLDEDEHLNKYDIIIMQMVTEHLQNNINVISSCFKYLKKNGKIWSSHANYYYWNGHHEFPRRIIDYDKNNDEHNKYIAWKHLNPENPVYYQTNLNRIKIKDLKMIYNKYFKIIHWDKDLDNEIKNLLNKNIIDKHKYLEIEDFISKHPIIYGEKRSNILDTDLNKIEFYHPITYLEKNIKNLIILDDLKCKTYPNNKYNIIYQKKLFENLYFNNDQLTCKLINYDKNINIKNFNSLGINFRLYEINLVDNNEYKFKFKMKANNEQTIGKFPKIYTGIKWITFDNKLNENYQIYEIVEKFKFSTSSKFRLGLLNSTFNDSFLIRDLYFYPNV